MHLSGRFVTSDLYMLEEISVVSVLVSSVYTQVPPTWCWDSKTLMEVTFLQALK